LILWEREVVMRVGWRFVLAAAFALCALAAAGSAAALNPQPLPPRVLGVVRDACTGLPVAGATVSLTSPTEGEANPGPSQTGPLGGFSIGAVAPGAYAFSVSAPGYDAVGHDPGPVGTAGASDPALVQVTLDPGPTLLPPGEAVSESIVAAVMLAPATPGVACGANPGPQQLPAVSGVVRSAVTGLPILRAQETLQPTSGRGQPRPDPVQPVRIVRVGVARARRLRALDRGTRLRRPRRLHSGH
jgi:Carboxypeptidase regulatory-like domain